MKILALLRAVVAVLLLLCLVSANDYFDQLEQLMKTEKARQASGELHSQFASDQAKEIEIICPGTPTVLIRDLIDNADSSDECM